MTFLHAAEDLNALKSIDMSRNVNQPNQLESPRVAIEGRIEVQTRQQSTKGLWSECSRAILKDNAIYFTVRLCAC